MKPYNDKLEQAKKVKSILDKYIYLTEKIQNETIHADTLMLFREKEVELIEQTGLLKEILIR